MLLGDLRIYLYVKIVGVNYLWTNRAKGIDIGGSYNGNWSIAVESLEIKPKKFNADKFILSYTLGELTDNRKLIVDQARRHFNCEHIEIFDDLKENKYVIGPCVVLVVDSSCRVCDYGFFSCICFFHSFWKKFYYYSPLW